METLGQLISFVGQATTRVVVLSLLGFQIAAVLTIPSVLLRRRGSPTSALLWLVVLITLPPVGLLSWWLIGRTRMERRLRKHIQKRRTFANKREAPITQKGTRFDRLLPPRALDEHSFSSRGNVVKLLSSGPETFAELVQRIDAAKRRVNMMFYIFEVDSTGQKVCDALIRSRKRGVEVRLLLDGFGARTTISALRQKLAPHGVDVQVFLPTRSWPLSPRMNFVNHRKIVVIDDHVGFVGGVNVGREYEHTWHDLMLCVEGPATRGLNHVFLEDWYLSTNTALTDPEALPAEQGGVDASVISSGPDTESWIHDAYFTAITQATDRLYLATPYFIPTPALATALRTAAGRGVDVRLVLPSLSDVRLVMWASRSFYRPLLSAGVRIYEYGQEMLHAKALVKDSDVCAIGSANLDNRSFRLNFEVSCFLADARTTEELVLWMEGLMLSAHEVTVQECDDKPTWRKLLESAAHLASPLL